MPSGEHPFDGEMILNKNKNKNKNKTVLSRIREQAHKGYWHAQLTDVLSLFSRSCIVIMICSGYVMGQA